MLAMFVMVAMRWNFSTLFHIVQSELFLGESSDEFGQLLAKHSTFAGAARVPFASVKAARADSAYRAQSIARAVPEQSKRERESI